MFNININKIKKYNQNNPKICGDTQLREVPPQIKCKSVGNTVLYVNIIIFINNIYKKYCRNVKIL